MRLFLASPCAQQYLDEEFKKSLFILESFFYFKEWEAPLIYSAKDFLLDSGAFTFLNNQKLKSVDFDGYLKRYINFINMYDIRHFFELDIDKIVGYKKVLEYREKLEYETNKKCIPVWHRSRGKDEYYRLCENYDYIAVGGLAIKEIKKSEYKFLNALCQIAKERDCKVHGLGFTQSDTESYKFYSCDSTSWQSGGRFAQVHKFCYDRIKPQSFKNKRLINYKELNRLNLREWIKYQKYLYSKGWD